MNDMVDGFGLDERTTTLRYNEQTITVSVAKIPSGYYMHATPPGVGADGRTLDEARMLLKNAMYSLNDSLINDCLDDLHPDHVWTPVVSPAERRLNALAELHDSFDPYRIAFDKLICCTARLLRTLWPQ